MAAISHQTSKILVRGCKRSGTFLPWNGKNESSENRRVAKIRYAKAGNGSLDHIPWAACTKLMESKLADCVHFKL